MLPLLILPLFVVVTLSQLGCAAYREAAERESDPRPGASGDGGGGGGRPPRPPPPHPGAAARSQMMAGALAAFVQLLVALTKWDAAAMQQPGAMADMAGCVLVLLVPGVLLPALAPHWFERHRHAVMMGMRLAYFALPYHSSPRAILNVYQGQPAQGRYAKLKDGWKLFLGAKGLSLLLSPLTMPLPLLPHILMTAFAVQRCRATATLCGLPMLRHDTWRRRISWAHAAAEMLPLVIPGTGGEPPSQAAGLPAAGAGDADGGGACSSEGDADCRVFLGCFQLALAAASIVLTARLQPTRVVAAPAAPSPPPAAFARPSRAGVPRRRGGSRQAQGRQQGDGGSGSGGGGSGGASGSRDISGAGSAWLLVWLQGTTRCCLRCLRLAAAGGIHQMRLVATEVEAGIQHLCDMLSGGAGLWVLRLAAWWLLLSCLWGLALALEQPSSLPATPAAAAAAAMTAAATAAAARAGGAPGVPAASAP